MTSMMKRCLLVAVLAALSSSAWGCTPDVDCPLFTQTASCSDAIQFDGAGLPQLQPVPGLPANLAARCPELCAMVQQCQHPDGASVTFLCDSVFCSSSNSSLKAAACNGLTSCPTALVALTAQIEKAMQCSCCVEAVCGCLPAASTVTRLAAVLKSDPVGFHNPVQCSGPIPTTAPKSKGFFKGKNVVVFLTDQERATMHFPEGWEAANLPGLTRLKAHGISFTKSRTSTCMCAPARATLLSGMFPAQHGVRYVLEPNMPPAEFPQVNLPLGLTGLAQVAAAAGYEPVYKGKLHVTLAGGPNATFIPSDAGQYGWTRWNPPDNGGNQDLCEGGGDTPEGSWPAGSCGNADERFMKDNGNWVDGLEGALAWLTKYGASPSRTQPFFLVVSLINPHDVLMYPLIWNQTNYSDTMLQGPLGLPDTVGETLLKKPTAQRQFTTILNAAAPLKTAAEQINYLNFYGNLLKKVDGYLVQLLDLMDQLGLTKDTVVVRTADHGEMGMAHGGQRQKMFNMYEESLVVPLVFSNPQLWPQPAASSALVSHVDFVPTMATLLGVSSASMVKAAKWQGVDYSKLVSGEASSVQDYIMFTYDDFQWGQNHGPWISNPNHIVALVEERYKIGKYYDPVATFDPIREAREQWEMYDLQEDPNEATNIANVSYPRTSEQDAQLLRLKAKLAAAEKQRLGSLMLKYPLQLLAAACQLPGSTTAYFGSVMGVPTGNGTMTLTFNGGKPTNLLVYSPIGAINAVITGARQAASGAKAWTGTATFTSGHGVFAGITGSKAALSFAPPPRTALCPSNPISDFERNFMSSLPYFFCWSPERCPGVFTLSGTVSY